MLQRNENPYTHDASSASVNTGIKDVSQRAYNQDCSATSVQDMAFGFICFILLFGVESSLIIVFETQVMNLDHFKKEINILESLAK